MDSTLKHTQPPACADGAASEIRTWTRILARYREPSRIRSVTELTITIVPLVLLWVLMWATLDLGYWFCLLLAIPAAGLLVRLFMIQHDCGHGAFFRHRLANDWVGRVIGVLTLTPYDFWRRTHAIHHASSGNLDRRGIGDIDTLTVREYLARSRWGRFQYRLYRHPAVMFGIGPAYLFILQHRFPLGLTRAGWQPWLSTMATNAAIAGVIGILIWFIGIGAFLLVHLPIMLLAASAGVWLFYVQHQFEDTFWAEERAWNVNAAALHGSSHYALPGILRWFTANIGVHHVHHLSSRIPYYRLPEVLREHPELAGVGRLTLVQSLRCVRLVLWDEGRRRLISFREMTRRYGRGRSVFLPKNAPNDAETAGVVRPRRML
jgi:omega-6 fatty acid desaturase (delta-12 desaturase)